MSQIYKVFINNFCIIITDFSNNRNITYGIVFKSVSQLIFYLKNNNYILTENVILKSDNTLSTLDALRKHFKCIKAAGGVVQNKDQRVLMIYKKHTWDLPKGKVNIHENLENCAVREIFEETGVSNLIFTDKSLLTFHIYKLPNPQTLILKETKWFLMKTNCTLELIPQIEEGITAVDWIPKEMLVSLKTYDSIKDVLDSWIY